MFTIILPPPSPNEEPPNEFTTLQKSLDRASWQGTGCTLGFEHDELSGGAEGAAD